MRMRTCFAHPLIERGCLFIDPPITRDLRRRMPERGKCLGVAIFYSKKTFKKLAEKRVYLPDEVEHLRQLQHHPNNEQPAGPSRLEYDLATKPDAAVMLRLQLREDPSAVGRTGSVSSASEPDRSITLVCCHLWFHPARPDMKTAQCKLLLDAVERFHEECGVLSIEKAGEGAGRLATNLVVCGDFNSLPVVQPAYWPRPLRVRNEWDADVSWSPFRIPSAFLWRESEVCY